MFSAFSEVAYVLGAVFQEKGAFAVHLVVLEAANVPTTDVEVELSSSFLAIFDPTIRTNYQSPL